MPFTIKTGTKTFLCYFLMKMFSESLCLSYVFTADSQLSELALRRVWKNMHSNYEYHRNKLKNCYLLSLWFCMDRNYHLLHHVNTLRAEFNINHSTSVNVHRCTCISRIWKQCSEKGTVLEVRSPYFVSDCFHSHALGNSWNFSKFVSPLVRKRKANLCIGVLQSVPTLKAYDIMFVTTT